MLSRSAQGLYWTGRYLERAEHLCRLMAHQIEALGDCSIEMIDRRWQRLYASIRREPVAGKLEPSPEDDAYIFADAYTLADDLTFEPQNPDSIGACVANARENIRQVRNAVSREMWGSLNTAYLELHTRRIEDIWVDRTEEFYKRTENAVRTFIGVADSTMYRDDSWSFFQLGRFLERAQLVAVLLDAHLEIYSTDQPDTESDWESLLSICLARGRVPAAPLPELPARPGGRFPGLRCLPGAFRAVCAYPHRAGTGSRHRTERHASGGRGASPHTTHGRPPRLRLAPIHARQGQREPVDADRNSRHLPQPACGY